MVTLNQKIEHCECLYKNRKEEPLEQDFLMAVHAMRELKSQRDEALDILEGAMQFLGDKLRTGGDPWIARADKVRNRILGKE